METSKYERSTKLHQLKKAVKRRDVSSVSDLLRDNPDIDKSQINKLKLMHRLFHKIKDEPEHQSPITEILTLFLDLGADVNIKNNKGHTLLHLAIRTRMTEVIDLLISRNAKLDVRDAFGDPLIQFLVREEFDRLYKLYDGAIMTYELEHESLVFVKWMILKGLDVDCQDKKGNTALHYTLRYRRWNFAKLLVKHCKNVDVRDKNGDTALHMMLEGNNGSENNNTPFGKEAKEMMLILLDKGANIHRINEDGFSPLTSLVESRQLKLLKLLKERGADFRRCYLKGNLLHYFFKSLTETSSETYEAILDLLLDEGCDVNKKDDKGMTPLHFAARRVRPDIAMKLIERGANVNSREYVSGYTALHEAVEYRNIKLVKMLIQKGADASINTKRGRTALHLDNSNLKDTMEQSEYWRRRIWHYDRRHERLQRLIEILQQFTRSGQKKNNTGKYIIPILIHNGAHIDVRDNDCILPLQAAILRQDDRMVEELLRYGADINDNVHVLSVNDYKLVSEVISEHLVKLLAANLPIDYKFKSLLMSNLNFGEIHEDCLVEVEKLKGYNITESTSLYGFLHRDWNSKCAYIKNIKLKDLMSSAEFKKLFPMYHTLISSAYYMAVERKKMLEPAKQIWMELTNIILPDLCMYEILSYLSNVHLRIMIQDGK